MSASRERPKLGFEVRMCGGGKIDHWVLRVTRDFESVFIYLFIYFLERETNKWEMKKFDAKVIDIGEGKGKLNRGKKLDKNVFG